MEWFFPWVLPLFGVVFLIFRFWLCEVYLRDILGVDRGHTSRFCSYYLALAMIFNFEPNVFTLISVVSAPAMVLASFAFDVPFLFFNEGRQQIPKKTGQIIERLTMHIPIILFGVYYYGFSKVSWLDYFALFTLDKLVIAILLTCLPMFVFDPRVTKRKDWPRGLFIVGGAILDIVGNIIFFFVSASKYEDLISDFLQTTIYSFIQ